MTVPERLDHHQIVEMNRDACNETSEHHALRDEDGLHAAVQRPWAGHAEGEHFPSLWDKAAALLHAIASRQVFENGNKRTAWTAAITFLEINGVEIGVVPPIQAEAFVRAVAVDHNFTVDDAAEWFEVTATGKVASEPAAANQQSFEILTRVVFISLTDDSIEGWLDLVMHHSSDDPVAVTFRFQTVPEVAWKFSRDLLVQGQFETAGKGDVVISPFQTHALRVNFRSPDGQMMIQLSLEDVKQFLHATAHTASLEIARNIDWDALLRGEHD